jgi:hypothetical protein
MPQNTGYKPNQISQIQKALDALSEAVEAIGDGEIKDQLMTGVSALGETVASMESAEVAPEDEMLDLAEDESGMEFGELQDMAPDMAGMEPAKKPAKKQRLGAMIEEDEDE